MTYTITGTKKPSSKRKASPDPAEIGNHGWRLSAGLLAAMLVGLLTSFPAWSYSYAAAGKEPLIEGRQALLSALQAGHRDAAQQALDDMRDELAYLQRDYQIDYAVPLQKAVDNASAQAAQQIMDRAFAAEIHRRLDGAAQHFDNYQVARVLVFKANRFLQLIEPQLSPANREQAEQAIRACVKAIGNPGVFGVGRTPPDPAAYHKAMKTLMQSLPKP